MKIEDIAEMLARALGHATTCRKLSCPCTCGAGKEQATALDEHCRWKKDQDNDHSTN
jgi:hypothetical protein